MDSIGERIKYLRKEVLNITQKNFGTPIGLKPNSISDIESGKNNPTEQTIIAICKEFNVNYEWLKKGLEPIKKDPDMNFMAQIDNIMTGQNKFAKILFKQLANLDNSQWETLESLVKNIVKEIE